MGDAFGELLVDRIASLQERDAVHVTLVDLQLNRTGNVGRNVLRLHE